MQDTNEITIPIEVVNKHLLYKYESGYLIIDSGSPASFCSCGKIEIGGIEYKCPQSVPLVDLKMISSRVGKEIIGLIGTDLLDRFDCAVFFIGSNDPVMGINYYHHKGSLQSENILGIGTATLEIDGKPLRLFVDTGAPISYVASQYTVGKTAVETRNDFHPIYGEFSTDVYEFSISDGNTIQMGVLPKSFEAQLTMLGVDGIIGIDFFLKNVLIWEKGLWYVQRGI